MVSDYVKRRDVGAGIVWFLLPFFRGGLLISFADVWIIRTAELPNWLPSSPSAVSTAALSLKSPGRGLIYVDFFFFFCESDGMEIDIGPVRRMLRLCSAVIYGTSVSATQRRRRKGFCLDATPAILATLTSESPHGPNRPLCPNLLEV